MGNMTYTMEEYSWGIVGSATPGGWGGPDLMLHYNPYQDDWKAVVTLIDGEAKFRFNNDWAINYGDDGGDGSFEANGANIAVSAGTYKITLDFSVDQTTLKTIVRANPGLIMLQKGVIKHKWHWRDVPKNIEAVINQ